MQFLYRGIEYDATPDTLETQPSDLYGTYRGCRFNIRQPHVVAPVAAIALKYRGVTYLAARTRTVASLQPLSKTHQSDPANAD